MKKGFFILITVIILFGWQHSAALGASDAGIGDASITLEGRLSAQSDTNSTENSWGSGVLSIDASVGPWKVTVESFAKDVEGIHSHSTNTKVGLAMLMGDFFRIDAALSYHQYELNDSNNGFGVEDWNGYLLGLDLQLGLSEQSVLEAAIGYTNAATWKNSTTDNDGSILIYKIKYDWLPWQNFGFSVGYRNYSYHQNSLSNADSNFSEVYCGLILHFNDISLSNGGPVQVWGRK